MKEYKPPEPVAWRFKCPDGYNLDHEDDNGGGEPLYSEQQLRSEVERIRRETVEECARIAEQYEETSIGHTAIRELLK